MVYRQNVRSETVRAAARSRILRSAKKLFAERGYDETTMQDIVRDAKTSIGNAYFYFANKVDLLTILLEEGIRDSVPRADAVIATIEPGAARIAVMVYSNLMYFLTTARDLSRIAITGEPSVVRHIVGLQLERLVALFDANLPGRSEKEILMSAIAVGGANRLAIELSLSGRLDVDPSEIASFLVRWQLRALNLPEPEIDRLLLIATQSIKPVPTIQSPTRRKARRQKPSA
jgi:AcrR family transcriptional regulator